MAAEMKVKWITPNGDGTYAITTPDGYHFPRVALSQAETGVEIRTTVTDFVVESDGSWTLARAPMELGEP
ncbi:MULTISPECIES: hypothetical protein [unclassified Methylobacterium]|jgi:hypothetical protein|uniref:hypothetical protein n=1 Tax=unclassified Methylobacterium TaxID=2615210 RepID=UPI001352F426|nr:hypothetical protein [Methylobacterium sp. 2A]MWV22416.1 hypothetical protein [Methylobacterium sp. 2A]